MSTTIHVKGSDLPASWREQANVAPDELLEITIKSESETGDGLMPPEEDFRPEFIAEVEQSSKEYHEGKKDEFITAKTPEEVRALLNKAINE